MPTPRVVKNLLYGTMVVLIGTVILVAVLMAAIQVVDDAPQIPDSWFLAVAVAMGLVAVGTSVRARAAVELQRRLDEMHSQYAVQEMRQAVDAGNRIHLRQHDHLIAMLANVEARTRGLTSNERATASEALEQVEAVRGILADLRERDLPLLGATQEAVAESTALLALAAAALTGVSSTPEQACERARAESAACAMRVDR